MSTEILTEQVRLQVEILNSEGQWAILCQDLQRKRSGVNFGELAGLQEGYPGQKMRVVERRSITTRKVLFENNGI